MKRKRYENDRERLKGWLDRLPVYRHSILAIEDIGSKRELRRACTQRNIDTDGFLTADDFMGALQKAAVDERCALCLDQFRMDDKLVVMLCEHEYHYDCLLKSILAEFEQTQRMPRCPLCRVAVRWGA